jgi:hypothetical protein
MVNDSCRCILIDLGIHGCLFRLSLMAAECLLLVGGSEAGLMDVRK